MNLGSYLNHIVSGCIRSLESITVASTLAVSGGGLAVAGLMLVVPCAQATDYYNLTNYNTDGVYTQGANNSAEISGGLFTSDPNKTVVGTGVLQPFVRIQQNGNGNCQDPCIESGYNTDGNEQFETKDNGGTNWNHSLLLSDVGTYTDAGGIVYREFILDINESNTTADRFLSLDKFKIYLGSVGNLDNYTETAPDGTGATDLLLGATKIYDMDFDADGNYDNASIGLNYDLNHGSGNGIDLVVRIPDALFKLEGNLNPNVYLYSSFGATGILSKQGHLTDNLNSPPGPAGILPAGNYSQSAGFEEWSTRLQVPEPMSASLFLIGFAAIGFAQRQRHSHTS